MGLKMATPFRHPHSGIFWYRRRVPADLIELVGKKEEKVSLRTRDPGEAKAAYIRVAGEVEARWANLRSGTRRLSHKEAVAIAGEFYRNLVSENEDDPGDPALILGRLLSDQVAAGSPEVRVIASGDRAIADRLLARLRGQNRPAVEAYLRRRGEIIDAESFERLVAAVNAAVVQGREQVLRFAKGDYRGDPEADRFPNLEPKIADHDKPANYYDLKAIYERFANEAKHAMATRKKWSAAIAAVAAEVPDIRNLDELWCVQWKDRLVARGLSPRSIQFGYLAALKSTCAWAVRNQRIDRNPVAGIGVKVGKAKRERGKGFTDEEAKFVLGLTLRPTSDRLSKEHKAARRWVPWLCCYTGARVGEIAQLRKQDIFEKDGVWVLWITPEAGTVKDGNSRFVPVHPHLVQQGFINFVRASRVGPLFYSEARKRGGSVLNPTSKKVGERLASWIRAEGFNDTRVAPNHGWRHRFKTKARKYNLDAGARDYLQGHVPATEGEKYGEFELSFLLEEISKLPPMEF